MDEHHRIEREADEAFVAFRKKWPADEAGDPTGAELWHHAWRAATAAERERIRALVQAVRDANRDAEDGGGTFRLLKPGQERAWMALLAGLDGPNVELTGKAGLPDLSGRTQG